LLSALGMLVLVMAMTTGSSSAAPAENPAGVQGPTNAALAEALDIAQTWGAANSDIYGGVWLDDTDAFLGVTQPDDPRVAEVTAQFPYPDSLTVVPVAASFGKLLQAQDDIDADAAQLRASGIPIVSTGLDVVHNTVTVGLETLADGVADLLTRQYGELITPVQQQVELALSVASGGSEISGSGSRCTAAFNLYDSALITAGHCFARGATIYNDSGIPFGTVTTRIIGDAVYAPLADVEVVDFASGFSPSDNILRPNNPNCPDCTFTIEGVDTSIVSGEYLCHTGITTQFTCGTVNSTSYSPCYKTREGTQCYSNLKTTTNDFCPGDSGGPVFHSRLAKGVVSGRITYNGNTSCGAGDGIFSGMDGVGNYINLGRVHIG
jgi:hypothetical protein